MNNKNPIQHPFTRREKKDPTTLPDLGDAYKNLQPANYMIIIYPHEDLQDRILKLKEKFANDFQAEYYRYTKPQVYISTFLQYEMEEQKIINRLTQIAKAIKPFKVDMSGFSSVPTHSIYINITKENIRHLVKEIKQANSLLTINKWNKAWYVDEPNIAIAKKLLPYQFEKGWLELEHTDFTASFIANEMILLKKSPNQKSFKPLYSFVFEDKKEIIKQASLFC